MDWLLIVFITVSHTQSIDTERFDTREECLKIGNFINRKRKFSEFYCVEVGVLK